VSNKKHEINMDFQNVQAWGYFKFCAFILHNIYRPLKP
jgi:hypothetical protein